jgi:hypothetical protein
MYNCLRKIKWISSQVLKTLFLQLHKLSSNMYDAYYLLFELILPITGNSSLVMRSGNKVRHEWSGTTIHFSAYIKLKVYKTTKYAYSLFKQRL